MKEIVLLINVLNFRLLWNGYTIPISQVTDVNLKLYDKISCKSVIVDSLIDCELVHTDFIKMIVKKQEPKQVTCNLTQNGK
jgi:hypothetical protein